MKSEYGKVNIKPLVKIKVQKSQNPKFAVKKKTKKNCATEDKFIKYTTVHILLWSTIIKAVKSSKTTTKSSTYSPPNFCKQKSTTNKTW